MKPPTIKEAFDGAHGYATQAVIQKLVAQGVAQRLSGVSLRHARRGLEIGCGTGFLSDLWVRQAPWQHVYLTDIAPTMIHRARAHLTPLHVPTSFVVMDGEKPALSGPFDLIVASLVFQWFHHPRESVAQWIRMLAPGGALLFSTLGPETFQEWRVLCQKEGVPCGLHRYPDLEFWHSLGEGFVVTMEEERLYETHDSRLDFLRTLKSIGAFTPAPGHQPISSGQMRRLLGGATKGFSVTHHLYYGVIRKTG